MKRYNINSTFSGNKRKEKICYREIVKKTKSEEDMIMKNFRSVIALALCAVICFNSTVYVANAQEATVSEEQDDANENDDLFGDSAVVSLTNMNVQYILDQSKFTASQGHGFAAERGNDLIDKIKLKNTKVVGDNNVKNGPDRIIINRTGETVFIQDKYYSTATEGIKACFGDDGMFKYVKDDGVLMQIEVPKEQYEEAVALMEKKISEGKVSGVTDPKEAKSLVRKGYLTYKQAKNLAKAGTVESLAYDSVHGVVSASCAFGISTILNYAFLRLQGENNEEAMKMAAESGLKSGASAFGITVIAGQLSKTGANAIFKPVTEKLVSALGRDFAKFLVESTGKEVSKYTTTKVLTMRAAKILSSQTVVSLVSMVVFSVPDAVKLFEGKISGKQFAKNFAVSAITVVGGAAGAAVGGFVGTLIVPGAGTAVGGIAGGLLGGTITGIGADKVADHIVEDDAVEMYEIVKAEFAEKCEDYLVNEEEATRIAEELNKILNDKMFEEMYQCKNSKNGIDNRKQYASDLLEPIFENEVAKREIIEQPTEEEMRAALIDQLEGCIFIH